MKSQTLPDAFMSLVHHVELNKSGWWDRSVQKLLLSALWLKDIPLNRDCIIDSIKQDMRIDLDPQLIDRQLTRLLQSGMVTCPRPACFKISEQARYDLNKTASEAQLNEQDVKNCIAEGLTKLDLKLDAEIVWTSFSNKFLLPLVKTLGANTYSLMTGGEITLPPRTLDAFLNEFPQEQRVSLRALVALVISPSIPSVRRYVLRQMNAYFFMQASGVKAEAILALEKTLGGKPKFRVFVDTNFLFSLLGIHENPSNESAKALGDVLRGLAGRIDVKLYMLPPTIEEARSVLIAARTDLSKIQMQPNLLQGASVVDFGGVAQAYFAHARRANISADSYLSPYIENFISTARSRGIELYNAKCDDMGMDPKVLEDITAQLDFQRTRQIKTRSYNQIKHDVILWHFVQGLRPAAVESPLSAENWIVTVDYRFIGFDRFKTERLHSSVPLCLHPSNLIQLLQFWIPQSDVVESAMLASLHLPLLCHDFDSDAEKVSIRILQTMSRFENLSDLSADVIGTVLVNDALRERLSSVSEGEQEIQLIREALIDHNRRINAQLEEQKREADALKVSISEQSAHIEVLKNKLELEKASLNDRDKEVALKTKEASDLKTLLHKKETQEKERSLRISLTFRLILIAVLFFIIEGLTVYFAARFAEGENVFQRLVSAMPILASIPVAAIIIGCIYLGKERLALAGWGVRRMFGQCD